MQRRPPLSNVNPTIIQLEIFQWKMEKLLREGSKVNLFSMNFCRDVGLVDCYHYMMSHITHKRSMRMVNASELRVKSHCFYRVTVSDSMKPLNLDMNQDRARTCMQHDFYFKMVLENNYTIIYGLGYKL